MRIIHAVCDEHGEGRGGELGDQTGREIRESNWYIRDGGWRQYIECTDKYLASHAVTIAKAIEKGDYGYNRDARWTGYISICNSSIEDGCGDFDCSSFVLSCFRLAGLNIKEMTGSTRDLAKILLATGKFKLYEDDEHLNNGEMAKKGSLYCTQGKHVVICIEDGSESKEEEEEEEEKKKKSKYVRAKGSVYVRELPVNGKKVAVMHKDDVLPYVGDDEETGWYIVSCGYVTNKKRYTEIVEL